MSAPQASRQSPEPEQQSNKQQAQPPASAPNDQNQAKSKDAPADDSSKTLENLESNPKHVLQDSADSKVDKK
jgi:hypothetical protein